MDEKKDREGSTEVITRREALKRMKLVALAITGAALQGTFLVRRAAADEHQYNVYCQYSDSHYDQGVYTNRGT